MGNVEGSNVGICVGSFDGAFECISEGSMAYELVYTLGKYLDHSMGLQLV